jgi:hypothetical protein
MDVARDMIDAARRAEFDFYQKGRGLGSDRFVPKPDGVIRMMLEAALKLVPARPGSRQAKAALRSSPPAGQGVANPIS